jgi:tRNA(Ile)-lysidine synthase TilS/MesJ
MIDFSRIRSLDKLEEMKEALNFFINKKIIADIYKERGIEDELNYDRTLAREALAKVLNQIDKLNRPARK